MAYVFNTKPVATITAKQVGESKDLVIPGVTNATTTADNAATQINKIIAVAGREISANGMIRNQVEEAVEQ